MFLASWIVRQTLFAALFLIPHAAIADIATRFDTTTGTVVVSGLDGAGLAAVLADPARLRLQAVTVESGRGMLVVLTRDDDALRITPQFPLRPGAQYALRLDLPDVAGFNGEFAVPQPDAAAPRVTDFAPSQAVIPANVLRLYLTFSEPMAAGQATGAIQLYREDGSLVPSPFLNLQTELWDRAQTRLTLIFDPGRIKQGVGPNIAAGAPLWPGESYRLVVSGYMNSAAGMALGADHVSAFRVGPANRHALTPENWDILLPAERTFSALTIRFDRIMDDGAVRRLLRILGQEGQPLRGRVASDGQTWSFTPEAQWQPGLYRLMVDAALEDVSGNTTRAAFDAAAGTIGRATLPIFIDLRIDEE